MTDKTILEEAAQIVDGPRRESYGDPAENHGRTAAMWGAYLGRQITATDVCVLNALQKLSRQAHSHSRDNLVDVCGYMRNIEILRSPKELVSYRTDEAGGDACACCGRPTGVHRLDGKPMCCSVSCRVTYEDSLWAKRVDKLNAAPNGGVDRGRCE